MLDNMCIDLRPFTKLQETEKHLERFYISKFSRSYIADWVCALELKKTVYKGKAHCLSGHQSTIGEITPLKELRQL